MIVPRQPVRHHGAATLLLLAAVAALASLATQFLVPALPQVAHDLRASPGDAQLIISLFLIGLGAGQLVMGPLSDRLGRKPVLLAGMALFCLGSVLGALAASLPLLLAARLAQALGGSAGIVVGRVLVIDLFPPEEHAARQATLMSVILVSPALAPVIGGSLSEAVGWRAIFLVLAAVGMASLALAALRLPGSGKRRPSAGNPGAARPLGRLLTNPRFLGPALAVAGGSASLYMFLGSAPFLLAHDQGLRPREVGLVMMVVASASIAGTFLVARLERRGNSLLTGTALMFLGGILLLLLGLGGHTGLPAFLGAITMLGLGAGLSGPAGITRVIRSEPGLEGTAASICGAGQMLFSAGCAFALGQFAPVSTLRLAVGLTLGCALGLAGALLDRQCRLRAM